MPIIPAVARNIPSVNAVSSIGPVGICRIIIDLPIIALIIIHTVGIKICGCQIGNRIPLIISNSNGVRCNPIVAKNLSSKCTGISLTVAGICF
jgi:hypothetical protein